MFGKNRNKKVGICLMVVTAFLVLAAVWAVLATPETALAKKPGGGGGKKGADIILVRADFDEDADHNIHSDGRFSCGVDHPDDGGLWDYWDPKDPVCGDGGKLKSDLSPGGRWIFNTAADESERWVVFHWELIEGTGDPDAGAVTNPSNPDLDKLIYVDNEDVLGTGGPPVDSTEQVDNLNIRITADVVFKDGNTRQSLSILIQWGGGSRPIYGLKYLEPLYIVRDPDNPDVARLTTFDPGGDEHVHEAELREQVDPATGDGHKGKSKPLIGTYRMPFTVTLRRVYVP